MPAKLEPELTRAEYFPLPPHPPEDVVPVGLPAPPLVSVRSAGASRLVSAAPPSEPTVVLISGQGLVVVLVGSSVAGSRLSEAALFQPCAAKSASLW